MEQAAVGKEISPKSQTTDSLWVEKTGLGHSLFKQPDFGIQRDSEALRWLFVAAPRGPRRYSPPHVPTSPAVTGLKAPQARRN